MLSYNSRILLDNLIYFNNCIKFNISNSLELSKLFILSHIRAHRIFLHLSKLSDHFKLKKSSKLPNLSETFRNLIIPSSECQLLGHFNCLNLSKILIYLADRCILRCMKIQSFLSYQTLKDLSIISHRNFLRCQI